ncbi:hypothetical protein T4E_6001 [Trichinella pseudospiralis]|uniref:Uncharacterized protein n=1 Tax=Trichinella pseudospiralis TaxID=6337 RepID=A0A0V0YH36_TRIPS|nr:hypothetical protein T4E_6001 [Trichinella pseudospiralis]
MDETCIYIAMERTQLLNACMHWYAPNSFNMLHSKIHSKCINATKLTDRSAFKAFNVRALVLKTESQQNTCKGSLYRPSLARVPRLYSGANPEFTPI